MCVRACVPSCMYMCVCLNDPPSPYICSVYMLFTIGCLMHASEHMHSRTLKDRPTCFTVMRACRAPIHWLIHTHSAVNNSCRKYQLDSPTLFRSTLLILADTLSVVRQTNNKCVRAHIRTRAARTHTRAFAEEFNVSQRSLTKSRRAFALTKSNSGQHVPHGNRH